MRTIDFSPLFRNSVGFDRVQRLMDAAQQTEQSNAYPPYNIEQVGENGYNVTLAVAGFAPGDIDITLTERTLVVSGKTTTTKLNGPSCTAASPGAHSSAASSLLTTLRSKVRLLRMGFYRSNLSALSLKSKSRAKSKSAPSLVRKRSSKKLRNTHA